MGWVATKGGTFGVLHRTYTDQFGMGSAVIRWGPLGWLTPVSLEDCKLLQSPYQTEAYKEAQAWWDSLKEDEMAGENMLGDPHDNIVRRDAAERAQKFLEFSRQELEVKLDHMKSTLEEAAKPRANYLPSIAYYNLNQACAVINRAFVDGGCFLVGSCLLRPDYRDVDVRFIMDDDAYDRLFAWKGCYRSDLWSLMCTTMSLWLSQQTGLPIDFQIQHQTHANILHPFSLPRMHLGSYLDYPGERPTDLKK